MLEAGPVLEVREQQEMRTWPTPILPVQADRAIMPVGAAREAHSVLLKQRQERELSLGKQRCPQSRSGGTWSFKCDTVYSTVPNTSQSLL